MHYNHSSSLFKNLVPSVCHSHVSDVDQVPQMFQPQQPQAQTTVLRACNFDMPAGMRHVPIFSNERKGMDMWTQ